MRTRKVEEVYELCPMQEGMLFHTQLAPEAGYYVEQFCCRLQGAVDAQLLQRAWQRMIDRHGILRASIVWNELQKPALAVHRQVPVQVEELDWREIPLGEQESCLRSFLQADRYRGIDFARPPLMRFYLIRIAGDQFHFVWTFHHLLLDGWSYLIVLKEVFSVYDALAQGTALNLQRGRPYRDYLIWRRHLDLGPAEVFWRRILKGVAPPPPLSKVCATWQEGHRLSRADPPQPNLLELDDTHGQQQLRLSPSATRALRLMARQHRLTLNTLLQGAWALLLHAYTGGAEVLFGATVAGRPPSLAGVESMVGVFINTLPVRVSVNPWEALPVWLKRLQDQQIELRRFECTPLVLIQKCADLPPGAPLFESILVYENIPFDVSLWDRFQSVKIRDVRFLSKTHYPLTVSVVAGSELAVNLNHERRKFDDSIAERILGHLRALLEALAENPRRRIAELPLPALAPVAPLASPPAAAGRSLSGRPWEPPHTAIERCLSEIWSAILGVHEVGLYDHFFDLGGHSLLAAQVMARVRETFQIDLSMRRLFEAPTLASLAAVIEEQLEAERSVGSEESYLKQAGSNSR